MRLFFAITLTALSFSVLSNQQNDYSLMQKWLNLESQKGKIQLNWAASEQSLKNQLVLLKEEKKALKALLASAKTAQSEVDAKRLALTEQQLTFEKNQNVLNNALENSYLFIKRVSPLLPPPLQQDWQSKLATFEQKTISNSEKLERLLSMYQSANEFNQRIAINNTSMQIPGKSEHTTKLINQIYLGLSYAWYISNDGEFYGLGRVEQNGWQWHHGQQADQLIQTIANNDLKTELLKIKTMLEKPTQASFVQAPLAIAQINKELL